MSQGIESNSTNVVASPSMQEEEIQVNSVSEFIEKIVQLDKEEGTETFYRGHANRDWELLPSIFRTPNGVEKEHLLFRDMVAHEPQSFSECKSALDYLVQMQHYGLPTRLLDMTTNPLVALYFACQPTPDDAVAGAVAGARAGIQVVDKALRVCVAISETLSQVEADATNETVARNIAQAILSGNSGILQKVKGIGAKTAERIIIDLRDKVQRFDGLGAGSTAILDNKIKEEALSALEVLGIPRKTSEKIADKILKQNPEASVEELVKQVLKNI